MSGCDFVKNKRLRILWLVLALLVFVCSAWNLLEGGMFLSTAKRGQLETLVTKVEGAVCPPIAVGEKENVVVALCENQAGGMYILEFSKNTLFDRYSLREAHRWYGTDPFATVASSAIRNYPYEVDLETDTVTIYDGSLRNNVWNDVITLVLSLLVLVIYPFERNKLERNKQ